MTPLALALLAAAQTLAPTDTDRAATRAVVALLESDHYLKIPFDDRLAGAALDRYLGELDPLKQFFLKADVSEFAGRRAGLAAKLRAGDVSVAFDVFNRYRRRVAEAEPLWRELITPPAHDFGVREVVVADPRAREHPADAAVAREQWRRWIKYRALQVRGDPLATDRQRSRVFTELADEYARLARDARRTAGHEVLENFLDCVGRGYDHATGYVSPARLRRWDERAALEGVGLDLAENGRVRAVVPNGPAAGKIRAGERVVGVGAGESGTVAPVARLTAAEVGELIEGPVGTPVRLSVRGDNEESPRTVALRRARTLPPANRVESRIILSGAERVGYLDVPDLYRREADGDSTSASVRVHLKRLSGQGASVILLDLRRNNGGLVAEGAALAALFLGAGPVGQEQFRDGQTVVLSAEGAAAWAGPLVVLVGRKTGGSAEMVAAALQDHRRGPVVGDDATPGAGLTFVDRKLPDELGQIRLTIAQGFRVTGSPSERTGVRPDILVPSPDTVQPRAEYSTNVTPKRLSALAFRPRADVTEAALLALRARSRERRLATPAFTKLRAMTEWHHARPARAVATLNEAEHLARRREEPDDALPRPRPDGTDFHLWEVAAVAADHARASAGPRPTIRPADTEREAARQSVQTLEDEVRVRAERVAAARKSLAAAEAALDKKAEGAGGAVSLLARLAAERVASELAAELRRAETELAAARDRLRKAKG